MKRVSVVEFTKHPDTNVYEIEDEYGKVFKKEQGSEGRYEQTVSGQCESCLQL